MKKKKNKEKYSTFSEFILNDDEIVMPLLLTISKWFGVIIFSYLSFVLLTSNTMKPLGVIFGMMTCFGWYSMIKFYRMGGTKRIKGLTAAQTIWNKEKIKVKNVKK